MLNIKKIFYKKNKYIKFFLIVFPYLFIICLIAYLFRDKINYGLNYDETLRFLPWISVFNRDAFPINQTFFSINIFGRNIPLLFKEYISSLASLKYLPTLLFNNYLHGLRFLEFFYFLLSILIFYHFLSKIIDKKFSFLISLMVAINPLYYPEIRFGFASTFHFFSLTLGLNFFKKFNTISNATNLFFTFFFFALMVNINFYSIWIFNSILLISLLFFREFWLKIFKSFKLILSSILGFLLGLFNFLIYNFYSKGGTFKPLYLYLFENEQYNRAPIDFKPLKPLNVSILEIITSFFNNFHNAKYFFKIFLIVTLFTYILVLVHLIRKKEFSKNIKYFFPLLITLIIFAQIIISPKAHRVGHFIMLSPFLEIALSLPFYYFYKKKLNKFSKFFSISSLILIVLLLFINTNKIVAKAIKNQGEGVFSSSIFQIYEYTKNKNNALYEVDWGFGSQLYFLSKGTHKMRPMMFNMMNKSASDVTSYLINFFITEYNVSDNPRFIYYNKNDEHSAHALIFENFIRNNGGEIKTIKQFYEINGETISKIVEIENYEVFYENIINLIEKDHQTKTEIINFGPQSTKKGTNFNVQQNGQSAMWLKIKTKSPFIQLYFDDIQIKSIRRVNDNLLTATIPKEIYKNEKKYSLFILDLLSEEKSNEVTFTVYE